MALLIWIELFFIMCEVKWDGKLAIACQGAEMFPSACSFFLPLATSQIIGGWLEFIMLSISSRREIYQNLMGEQTKMWLEGKHQLEVVCPVPQCVNKSGLDKQLNWPSSLLPWQPKSGTSHKLTSLIPLMHYNNISIASEFIDVGAAGATQNLWFRFDLLSMSSDAD